MNSFRDRLYGGGPPLLGLWQALADSYAAEVCAGCGYDWLLFDGEHAPNTLQTMLAQLQAVAAYPVEPIARLPAGDPVLIKQHLDIGFRTLLIPMVDSAHQARAMVSATRFPPEGVRGVASATSRASGFGRRSGYLGQAHAQLCLLLQIESRAGVAAIEEIAAVDGVDGLFIGPSDLAGALGHLGDPRHADVQRVIADALRRIKGAGKPAGIFALDAKDARDKIDAGVRFVSIGTDVSLLTAGGRALLDAVVGELP